MSTHTQMYKCGGCEGQFDVDEALRHQHDQRMCCGAKILPIRWTQWNTHKDDLFVRSSREPSSTIRKASSSQKPISAKKVANRKKVHHGGSTDGNSIPTGSRSTRGITKEDRLTSSSIREHNRSHDSPPVHEPFFSPTDAFVREPTPFAFVGRGSATRDEYDHPIECRDTDYSIDFPVSYEDLRDKSPYTPQGFSPNYVLYPKPLPLEYDL